MWNSTEEEEELNRVWKKAVGEHQELEKMDIVGLSVVPTEQID